MSSQRKFVLGLVVIVAVVAVGVIIMVASAWGPMAGGPAQTIKKTDRQVYLLGTSSNTDIILEQLRKGTSNIVQLSSLSQLPTNASSSILFIDGQWPQGQPNATYSKTAAALTPLVLNGTPMVIIDGEDLVIQLIIEAHDISYLSQQGDAGTLESHGLFYNQSTGFSASFGSSISDPHEKAVAGTVVQAYNWADDYISGALPRDV